jgi:hypothetical protein
MSLSPRIRRSAAAIAALGTTGTGIGLFTADAEALPAPVTQYGPTTQVTALWAQQASPPLDLANSINASGSSAGSTALNPTGYAYSCDGPGGVLAVPSTAATGAKCTWPAVLPAPTPYPQRAMTARTTDTSGLSSALQIDVTSANKGPNISFTATAGSGAGEQRVVFDTAGSTTTGGHAAATSVSCGDGSVGVHDSGTLWHCDYSAGGSEVVSVTMVDSVTNLDALRQARIYVLGKPAAALAVTHTGTDTVSANIAGSHVDPDLTGTFQINWGDGSSPLSVDPTVATTFPHTYATSGAHTVTLTVTDSAGGIATASMGAQPTVNRYSGQNRYLTGTALSALAWDPLTDVAPTARHPQAVVLARGDGYADALAGVPLAAKKKGPLLLTPTAALDANVQTEIQRILPTTGPDNTVYIVGGLSAVSQNVENQLTALGYHVVRFGEADRFATALKIATDPNAMNNPARVVVATGYNFPDALSAGPYAALPSVNAAIVLSQNTAFDPATGTYVAAKLGAGGNVTAVGGQAVSAVGTLPGSAGKFVPFAGGDRYQTAAKVAGYGGTSAFAATAPAGLATGTAFPDALTGGAFMAQLGGPMLLTDPLNLSPVTSAELTALKPTVQVVDIFGGTAAVAPGTALQVVTAVNGVKNFAS